MPRAEVPEVPYPLGERWAALTKLQKAWHHQVRLAENPLSGGWGHRCVQVHRRPCAGNLCAQTHRDRQPAHRAPAPPTAAPPGHQPRPQRGQQPRSQVAQGQQNVADVEQEE